MISPVFYVSTSGTPLSMRGLGSEVRLDEYSASADHFLTPAFDNEAWNPAESPHAMVPVDLGPGDTLYIPTGWTHEVFSTGSPHTAVNFWWHAQSTDDVWKELREFCAAGTCTKVMSAAAKLRSEDAAPAGASSAGDEPTAP